MEILSKTPALLNYHPGSSAPDARARHVRRSRKTSGQALAEFALILPVLLLALFGVIDFGWMVFNYAELYNGLREALRYASVGGYTTPPQYFQCDEIRNIIMTTAGTAGVKTSDITIQYDKGNPNATPLGTCLLSGAPTISVDNGYRVAINVNVTVQFLTPLVRFFAPQGMKIQIHGARSIYPRGF